MPKLCMLLIAAGATFGLAQTSGQYKVLKAARVGGEGGWDYIYADAAGRRLYIPRGAMKAVDATDTVPAVPAIPARLTIFNLDTLEPAGQIVGVGGNGTAVDPKSGHGFTSDHPKVSMFDTKTMTLIKTIDVGAARPDGIYFDDFNDRVYVFSHPTKDATVIDSKNGTVLGTIDLGGVPEQGVADGKGMLYVVMQDAVGSVTAVDVKTMKATGHFSLAEKGGCNGLALDVKNEVLFAACGRSGNPPTQPAQPMMAILSAIDGKILASLPLAGGSDGAVFNPATMEAFSTHGNGTMTIVKEKSPTSFEVEQNLQTMTGARTVTLDSKTGRLFAMAQERGPAPASPPAGGRGGQGPPVPGSFTILMIGTQEQTPIPPAAPAGDTRPARPPAPSRDPNTPGFVTAKDLADGVNPPVKADGNFIIGPTHNPAAEMAVQDGVPQGEVFNFTMESADSRFYPGIAREPRTPGQAPPAPGAPRVIATHPAPYTRKVAVYVPKQYVAGTAAPFIVGADGPDLALFKALDNLIAQHRVPAMIAISLGNGGGDGPGSERGLEYDTMSPRYAEFVEKEVLPLVEKQCNVKLTKDPEGRATMGGSSGGSAALIMAWYHPELYHRVLTYSGTYVNQQSPANPESPHGAWEFHEHLIPASPAKPIRLWMEVGDRDNLGANDGYHDWVLANENMARELAAKGYHYQFVFARNAGHTDRAVKQQTLPEALEYVWQGYPIAGLKK